MGEPETRVQNTIGKYEILGTLGRGSMGIVYKARDPEIGRVVAVKTLRRVSSDKIRDTDTALERFKLEARSAGNLKHHNIVTIFEVNREQDTPYLVMEYVEGESLDALISKQAPLEPRLVLHYLAQVAAGIDYAHGKGVVHRDIKPSNILIDKNGHVFILDFGVATINESVSLVGSQTTPLVGSPAYMSPEQILNQKLDRRSDLFSLGVVAFECLTAKRPFLGDTFQEVVSNILSAKPLAITSLCPHLPLALELEFEWALAKDKERRFDSAREMVAAFCRAVGVSDISKTSLPLDISKERKRKSSGWQSFKSLYSGNGKVKEKDKNSSNSFTSREEESTISPWELESGPINWHTKNPALQGNIGGNGFSDLGATIQKTEELGSSFIRRIILFLGGLILALSLLILWVLWDDTDPASKIVGRRSVDFDSVETTLSLDSNSTRILSLPEVEPVPEGKDVHEMRDKEVLGVIINNKVSENTVLKALREAQRRSLSGLLEACIVPLQSDSYVLRIEAIKVLSDIGDKRIVPQLVLRLDDHDPLVRGHAARALGVLGDRASLGYLMARYQKEEVGQVKSALKRAIEKINGFPMK